MVPRKILPFVLPVFSRIAALIFVLTFSGCATGTNVGQTAPHSTVSRDNALVLAKHVANSIGGRVFAIAPSGSMLPTLDEGSIVTIEKVALDKLHVGDIIIYRNASGMAVIHRLYEQHGDRWFVLGDNNTSVDHESVSAGNFIGRVCAIFYTASATTSADTSEVAPAERAVASRN